MITEFRLFDSIRDKILGEEGIMEVFSARKMRRKCEVCEKNFAMFSVIYDIKTTLPGKLKKAKQNASFLC